MSYKTKFVLRKLSPKINKQTIKEQLINKINNLKIIVKTVFFYLEKKYTETKEKIYL